MKASTAIERATGIAEISERDLVSRMYGAACGLSPLEAAIAIDEAEPKIQAAWRRAAHGAMDYWRECLKNMQRTS